MLADVSACCHIMLVSFYAPINIAHHIRSDWNDRLWWIQWCAICKTSCMEVFLGLTTLVAWPSSLRSSVLVVHAMSAGVCVLLNLFIQTQEINTVIIIHFPAESLHFWFEFALNSHSLPALLSSSSKKCQMSKCASPTAICIKETLCYKIINLLCRK